MSNSSTYPIKRKERAVTDDAWIKKMLQTFPAGVFGFSADEQPYLNSTLFIYDEVANCLYFHTAGYGRTREWIEQNNKACFTIYEIGRMVTGSLASHFSVEYASIVVFGTVDILTDEVQIQTIFEAYFQKYSPHLKAGVDYSPFTREEAAKATMYRFNIHEWSGKKHRLPDTAPYTHHYAQVVHMLDEDGSAILDQ